MTNHNSEPAETVEGISPARRSQLASYLVPILLCPVLLLLVAFYIVPSHWLAVRAGNLYLPNVGYGATLHSANCEIVITGDSSAMVGLDPKILAARTGLTACNIADFEGMTLLNQTVVLDRYLAQNARPRFLIFAYAPEDFAPESQINNAGTYEAVNWRMAQPGKFNDVLYMLHYPDAFFVWGDQGLRLLVGHALSKPASQQQLSIRADHDGQLPVHGPALTGCNTGPHKPRPNRAWVAALRSEYGVGGTTVLMDAVPVPPCDPDLQDARAQLAGVIDNSVQTLPLYMYITEGRLHMNKAGATAFSNLVADQILRQEHSLQQPAKSSQGER